MRKFKQQTTALTACVSRETYDKVEKIAIKEDRTLSHTVARLIEKALGENNG